MATANDLFIPGPAGKLSLRTTGLEAKPAHIVILVQGANLSGQLGYDFAFCGRSDYSMMEALVVVPDGGDYGHLQDARHRMWRVAADSLDG